MPPGPALVAADGGDEAIGVEVPEAGGAGLGGDRPVGLGPVGACLGTEALGLLEEEPVGGAPVRRASGCLPHVEQVEHGAAAADGRALVAEAVDGGHGDLQHRVSALAQAGRDGRLGAAETTEGGLDIQEGRQEGPAARWRPGPARRPAMAGRRTAWRGTGPRRCRTYAAGPAQHPRRDPGRRRVSLVHTAVLPPLAGQGFAAAAGSVPDARCRARAAPRRAPHGLRRGGGRGEDERPATRPWARSGAVRDGCQRLQAMAARSRAGRLGARPFRGDDPDCVAVRGARVPARSCLSCSIDGDTTVSFQYANWQEMSWGREYRRW